MFFAKNEQMVIDHSENFAGKDKNDKNLLDLLTLEFAYSFT